MKTDGLRAKINKVVLGLKCFHKYDLDTKIRCVSRCSAAPWEQLKKDKNAEKKVSQSVRIIPKVLMLKKKTKKTHNMISDTECSAYCFNIPVVLTADEGFMS